MSSFNVSPATNVSEIDATTAVPQVATTSVVFAGVFGWGPCNEATLVVSPDDLDNRFFPCIQALNSETYGVAQALLSYGGSLYISRACDATTFNAIANTSSISNANVQVQNLADAETTSVPGAVAYYAKYPGALGNSLRISVCDSAAAYKSTLGAMTDSNNALTFAVNAGSRVGTFTITNTANTPNTSSADTEMTALLGKFDIGTQFKVGNSTIGYQYMQVRAKSSAVSATGVSTATVNFTTSSNLSANVTTATVDSYWEFWRAVGVAPGTSDWVSNRGGTGDELHIAIIDNDGLFTGEAGKVLKIYQGLSRATDAMGPQGGSIYYANVLRGDQWVYWGNDRAGANSDTSANVIAATTTKPLNVNFIQGRDSASESNIALGSIMTAYNVYAEPEQIDISLVLAGKARQSDGVAHITNLISLVENRADAVLFFSPPRETVVNNIGLEAEAITAFRDQLPSSSYAFMDSGYKYTYDKASDLFRYIPLNGDIAGLAVRTDNTRDPWFSPAGYNRGQIKNCVKLAFNPVKAERDILFADGVNPVVSFPGQGTILFGDKTLLAKPSAFDAINVRRLFIVLEKAIATAAKFSLFEFNDDFTQSQFRNMVEPYLRQIQGRRGITDFKVVCDATNNTPEVVDSNSFVGDIYIKPARAIRYIQLNFVAVRTGVDFSEIVGQF